MISIMIIECGEVHLGAHLIFIGTQMIFGGIGEVTITLCPIIGIDLDCMDTIDGHHLDMIDGDTIIAGVGMDIMDMDSTIGVGEIE
jgi:hypothetical protein